MLYSKYNLPFYPQYKIDPLTSFDILIQIFLKELLFHYIDIFHELNIHPLYPQIHEPEIILIPVFGIYHKLFSKSTPPPICS